MSLKNLDIALNACDSQAIRSMLKKLVPGYQSSGSNINWGGGLDISR